MGVAAGALVRNEDHSDGVCRGLKLLVPTFQDRTCWRTSVSRWSGHAPERVGRRPRSVGAEVAISQIQLNELLGVVLLYKALGGDRH